MKLKITVHGVAYEVDVEILDPGEGFVAPALPQVVPLARNGASEPTPAARPRSLTPAAAAGSEHAVASPIAGTVLEVKCRTGESVSANQVLLVLEAMKMKTSITAPTAGRIKAVPVAAGDTVREGQTLVELE